MPKVIDVDLRKREISNAVISVIASKGIESLTFRSVAAVLGGSPTLITHFYKNRDELIRGITLERLKEFEESFKSLTSAEGDPSEALDAFLENLVPKTAQEVMSEKARIALLTATDTETHAIRYFLDEHERIITGHLRWLVAHLVPKQLIEDTTDALRAISNGIVLSTLEHPEKWNVARQLRLLKIMTQSIINGKW